MDTKEAFDLIQRRITSDPRKTCVDSFFDERNFGDFWVTYEQGGGRLSVVNDRGQLILYEGPASDHFRAMLISDLRSASESAVRDAVG